MVTNLFANVIDVCSMQYRGLEVGMSDGGEASAVYRRQAWFMVGFATIGVMCSVISTVMINTGLFIRPLGAAFGWSRGDVVASLSIGALVMAVANPFVGQLIDRLGSRRMLILSQLGFGLATAAIPWLISTNGISGLYLGYALISILGAGSTIVGFIRLLSGWFSGPLLGSRGFALGCCSAGVPLGAALSGPLAIYLIAKFGWAGGFHGLALIPLLIALPISIFAVREAPLQEAARHGNVDLPGLTLREASRTGHFWKLIALVFLISACLQGLAIHMAPFLQDVGLPLSSVAIMTTLIAAIGIPARLVAGHLFDRFFAPRVAFVVFALPAISTLLMASHPVAAVAIGGSILLGIGQGAESDLIGYLVSRYFGLRHSGRIFGTVYAAFMVGIAFGPFASGRAHDYTHSYQLSFTLAALGLFAICALLLWLPRFPAEFERRAPEA
ncbi:MFS transporter [Sphingomonas crocodyli]|nr:MFS transporter [Sphingomonas crocodyli]